MRLGKWSVAFGRALVEIVRAWFLHDHSRSAAALAFYSLFSLVPLLVISTGLAGTLIGVEAARAEIASASSIFLDDESSAYLLELLDLVEEQKSARGKGWMSIVAFGVLLFSSSKVVMELRDVLSRIFGAKMREGRREWIIGLALDRLIPILLILSLGFVIAITAFLGVLFHLFLERLDPSFADLLRGWVILDYVVAVVVQTLLFTFALRWLPPTPPSLRAALGGALVAGLLLGGVRHLISLYFQNAGVTSVFGAAVTLVVVLLWIYFSFQIFFIGAETAGYFDRERATQEKKKKVDGTSQKFR